jgi:hypothetical protein
MSTGVVRQMNNAKQTYERSKVDSRYSIRFGSEELYGARVDSEHGKQTQALDNKDGFEELLPFGKLVVDSKHPILAIECSHISV